MLLTLLLLSELLQDKPALAQRTTILTMPRQTLTVESQAERNGQTIQWQRGITTESGETFRYTTEAVFDSDSGVSGQITGEHTRATFEGTTQREGNAVTHQRTVET